MKYFNGFKRKRPRWRRKQQAEFFERLSRLLENGFDLKAALALLQRSCPKWQHDLQQITLVLDQGGSFPDSLQGFVRSGLLDEMMLVELHGQQIIFLNTLGQREHQRNEHAKKFWQLASYPLFLFLMMGGMTYYLTISMQHAIFPSIGLGMVIKNGACIVVLAGGVHYLGRRFNLKQWLLHVPYLGSIWRLGVQAQLCFQMGCLLRSGIELTTIFNYFQRYQNLQKNPSLQIINHGVQNALHLGLPLTYALKFMPLLPYEVQTLFESGHPAARIGQELMLLAEDLNREMTRKIKIYLQFLQPMLFIILGICIVALYSQFLLPTYQDFGEYTR